MSIIWDRNETPERVVIRATRFLPALVAGILLILVAFAYLPSIIYGYLLGSALTVVLALDTWRVQHELLRAQAFQALSASGSLLSLRNPLTYVIDKSRL